MGRDTITGTDGILLAVFVAGFGLALVLATLWPVAGEPTLVFFRSKAALAHAPINLPAADGRILRLDAERRTALVRFERPPNPFALAKAGALIALRASGARGCGPAVLDGDIDV
ncbi:MAG: hypothetical protein ACFB6R_16875 [Alphaproteobacteria bacterium]